MPVVGGQNNKTHWLNAMVEQHEQSLLRMCYLYLHDLQLAEDAVQETFVKAYQRYESFRGDSSEKTWLVRIAINTCKDMRKAAWYRYVDRRIPVDQLPAAHAPCKEEDTLLTIEVMRLPRKLLEVVLLYHYQGMTMAEIASLLSLTTPSVSARLKRAHAKLRKVLEGGHA